MPAALGFSTQGARSPGCAQGVVPSPPFPGRSRAFLSPALSPLTPSAPHPGWSRVRRGVPAVGEVLRRCLSGAFSKPVGVWGRRGEGGSPPARGLTWGAIPGQRSLGRAATPAVETRAGFPPLSTLASRGRAFSLQQEPKASSGREEAGPGGGGGRAPFAGSIPLREEDKASERSGSSTRAQCARRASSRQERRGVPARTGLGEEAELCALESESPARSGSETTCSCSYLPAPPRKQQCFSRARACVVRECVRGVCGVCAAATPHPDP